jgi:hypothetical protein
VTGSQFDEITVAREWLLERFSEPTDLGDPEVMADAWRD